LRGQGSVFVLAHHNTRVILPTLVVVNARIAIASTGHLGVMRIACALRRHLRAQLWQIQTSLNYVFANRPPQCEHARFQVSISGLSSRTLPATMRTRAFSSLDFWIVFARFGSKTRASVHDMNPLLA
jgi:hypothetical protein